MPVNLSIRNYTLNIAGLDCTRALVSFDGADSKIQEGDGLVSFTGTLVLGKPIGFPESLDDRINSRWDRGNSVNFQLADDDGILKPPPRGGSLKILDSKYDPKTRKLTIQIGDQFALLKSKAPIGDKSGVCLGKSASLTTVINRLLAAAGCSECLDEIEGTLNHPTPKLLKGSYIDQAGAIAASAGYVLCCDSLGQIRAGAIAIDATPIMAVAIHAESANVERLSSEPPPTRLTITGTSYKVRRNRDSTTIREINYAPASVLGGFGTDPIVARDTLTTDKFTRLSKQREVETLIKEPEGIVLSADPFYAGSSRLINSGRDLEIYEYEINNLLIARTGTCEKGNQGRLKRHIIESYRTKQEVFSEIYSTYPKKIFIPGKQELTLAERKIIEYDYSELTIVQAASNTEDLDLVQPPPEIVEGPIVRTSVFQPIGAVTPQDFAYRKNGLNFAFDMTELVQAEYEEQDWDELNPGEWCEQNTTYQALALAKPDAVDNLRAKYKALKIAVDPHTFVGLTHTSDKRITSNSGQAQPPAPDSYPPEFHVTEKPIRARFRFPHRGGAEFAEWNKDIDFQYLSVAKGIRTAKEQAQRLSKLWGAIIWGRYKGTNYTMNLSNSWWNYEPLCRINAVEPEATFAYLADGFAIAIAGSKCTVSFDGILLGQVHTQQMAHQEPEPSSKPIEVIVPLYRQTNEIEASSGGATELKFYPYSRQTRYFTLEASSGSAVMLGTPMRVGIEASSGGAAQLETNYRSLVAAGGTAIDMARDVKWSELTAEQWEAMGFMQWRMIT